METVSVWLKTKPLLENGNEASSKAATCISTASPTRVFYEDCNTPEKSRFEFKFNRIMDETVTQSQVFNFKDEIPAFIDQAFAGRNVLITTYGQTNSGKTFTMIGDLIDEESRGILPRTLKHAIAAKPQEVQIQLQMMEIYNEDLRDLFLLQEQPTKANKIQIRNDVKHGTCVTGLESKPISTYPEAIEYIQNGMRSRTVSETKMNKSSSRSHCIVFILLRDSSSNQVLGRVGLADLAGSERIKKTGTTGLHLKEGGSINKSLSALEKAVNDLYQKQKQKQKKKTSTHVNFRDSKLTRILQPFLNGEGHSIFILCVSLSSGDSSETFNTMKFGQRLQGISQTVMLEAPASSSEAADLVHAPFPGGQCTTKCFDDGTTSTATSLFLTDFAWSLLAILLFTSLSNLNL